MSNCIRSCHPNHEIVLDSRHFDFSKLIRANDTDGNCVYFDPKDNVWVVRMASLTTNREWCSFLWDYLQPAVLIPGARMDWEYLDEYDNFASPIKGVVCFQPPGTVRPNKPGNDDYQIWRKMWSGC